MDGMYNCPLMLVGYCIFTFGQMFSDIASLITVKDPLINAWLAIIAATVAIITPVSLNHSGIIEKKGFTSGVTCPLLIIHAACPK